MWIVRISRNSGDKVVKDELHGEDISELLEMLGRILESGVKLLEIHIYKGGEDGK